MQLPKRRTSHRPRTGEGWAPTSVRDWPAVKPAPLTRDDLLTFTSEPVTITAGERLRSAPCLLCQQPAGGQLVKVVTLVSLMAPPGPHGRLMCRAYLVHAACLLGDDLDLHLAAHRLETPGCAQCRPS